MKAYHFGDRLKYFRKTAGLTQAALAEKVGISTHHVTQIERGLTLPRPEHIYQAVQGAGRAGR